MQSFTSALVLTHAFAVNDCPSFWRDHAAVHVRRTGSVGVACERLHDHGGEGRERPGAPFPHPRDEAASAGTNRPAMAGNHVTFTHIGTANPSAGFSAGRSQRRLNPGSGQRW